MLPSVLPTESDHVPVLADEVVAALDPRPGEAIVDATFGAGGHARAARDAAAGRRQADRDRSRPDGRAVLRAVPPLDGCARPPVARRVLRDARAACRERVAGRRDPARPRRVVDAARPARARLLVRGRRAARHADGSERDYSARELVNETEERELADIFKRFGEERYAKQIARAIVRRRKQQPFERTGELVDVIKAAIPAPARFGEGHPAKRVFQALRIEVNDELGALERALPAALQMLRPGGRLGVISFHSLEDRLVKRFLRNAEHGCTCPPDFPVCVCGSEPTMRATPRRAIRPSRGRGRPEPTLAVRAPPGRHEGRLSMASASHAQAAVVAEPLVRPRTRTATRGRKRAPGARTRRDPLDRDQRDSARGCRIRERGGAPFEPRARRRERDRVKLRAENAALQSELSSRLRSAQIQAQASRQLGLEFQDPSEYGYIDLTK